MPELRATLESEVAAFSSDITAALDAAIVRDNTTSKPLFVPPVAGSGQPPFTSMTMNTQASYLLQGHIEEHNRTTYPDLGLILPALDLQVGTQTSVILLTCSLRAS
jgi:hypothetical protein